jgi:hypothetical protein
VSWVYPASRAMFFLSRRVSWCTAVGPCIAVVTDIWRTESGQEERFTEPLAFQIWGGQPASVTRTICRVSV